MLPYLAAATIVIGFADGVRRQQRDGILLLLGEYPDPIEVDERRPVAAAQRRVPDDPLCALPCLFVFRVVIRSLDGLVYRSSWPGSGAARERM